MSGYMANPRPINCVFFSISALCWNVVQRFSMCSSTRFGDDHVKVGLSSAFEACASFGIQDITEKNASTIDKEGWLHSGDKAHITDHN